MTGARRNLRVPAFVLSLTSLGFSSLSLVRMRAGELDWKFFVYMLKIRHSAHPRGTAFMGLAGAALGVAAGSPWAALAGGAGAALSVLFVRGVAARADLLEGAFGRGWETRIDHVLRERMLDRRRSTTLPPAPRPRIERGVPYWKVPGTERELLCDVWRPPEAVASSGLALLYFHGGGYQDVMEDPGRRPFFPYLTAQGHTIVYVYYRLCPETDMWGIVGDVKRAVAWAKTSGSDYGIDPDRVVLGGDSCGGHLALLAAYTPNHPRLDPEDVNDADTSVRAVVSLYGESDFRGAIDEGARSSPAVVAILRKVGLLTEEEYIDLPERTRLLLGGLPREVPDRVALVSPVTHVGPHCPPTLLLHGSHDFIVPVERARDLYSALRGAGVPVVYVELPRVDHAFDMSSLRKTPAARTALYYLERFLALV